MSRLQEQKRADFSLKKIRSCQSVDLEDLLRHIRQTPVRILTNGLGQALAFLLADTASGDNENNSPKKASTELYEWLTEWLCGKSSPEQPARVYPSNKDLMKQLMEGKRKEYILAQEEMLRLFVWLKKFAEAGLLGEER